MLAGGLVPIQASLVAIASSWGLASFNRVSYRYWRPSAVHVLTIVMLSSFLARSTISRALLLRTTLSRVPHSRDFMSMFLASVAVAKQIEVYLNLVRKSETFAIAIWIVQNIQLAESESLAEIIAFGTCWQLSKDRESSSQGNT